MSKMSCWTPMYPMTYVGGPFDGRRRGLKECPPDYRVEKFRTPTGVHDFCVHRTIEVDMALVMVMNHYRPTVDADAVAVLREAEKLIQLMDAVPVDASLGEETDRVFPRYEFDGLRKAVERLNRGDERQ